MPSCLVWSGSVCVSVCLTSVDDWPALHVVVIDCLPAYLRLRYKVEVLVRLMQSQIYGGWAIRPFLFPMLFQAVQCHCDNDILLHHVGRLPCTMQGIYIQHRPQRIPICPKSRNISFIAIKMWPVHSSKAAMDRKFRPFCFCTLWFDWACVSTASANLRGKVELEEK